MFEKTKDFVRSASDSVLFTATLTRDKMLMSTKVFSSSKPKKNEITMEKELESTEARQEFIKNFADGFYNETGREKAVKVIENINNGLLYSPNPVIYMDRVAEKDDLMLAIAAYLAESDKKDQVRMDYLSNKFIIKLNSACEYMGLPKYVTSIKEEDLTPERVIKFDDPDFSKLDPEVVELMNREKERNAALEAKFEELGKQFNQRADEYNAKLKEEAMKELAEEEAKKAEKEAKKAEKKAQKEAKKAEKEAEKEEKKKADAEAKAIKAEKGASVFKLSRGRAAATSNNSTGSTNTSSASKSDAGNGGSGKSDDSSGDGDPDPASHPKKKINMDEVIPLDKVLPITIIDDPDEKSKILEKAEQERQAFIAAMHSGESNNKTKATEETSSGDTDAKVQRIAETIQNGGVPTMDEVNDALASTISDLAAIKNPTFKRKVQYESGRFPLKEINGRNDMQLIQDALTEAVSTVPGVTVSVTPGLDPDSYNALVSYNGVMVDTFVAYGNRILGKGVPVLDGNVIAPDGKLVPFFVPIHSMVAVRENIFRHVEIKNIDGEVIHAPQGTHMDLADGLMMTVCADYRLLDHIDLSNHAFTNDEEAAGFFHVMASVLNAVSVYAGYSFTTMPIYRVANYRSYTKFELFGDMIAFANRALFKADTSPAGPKQSLEIGPPDGRRIQVTGKNLVITEPSGNTVQLAINY